MLNQEKKLLYEKHSKYDQLLDQKQRIEEIVNHMKDNEVIKKLLIIYSILYNF